METIPSKLICPVCEQVFKEPRVLPCLHTFCTNCLKLYISKTSKPGGAKCFHCPVCKLRIEIFSENSDRKREANDFPCNTLIGSLAQTQSEIERQTSEKEPKRVQLKCIPCSLDGRNAPIFSFCTTCTEYLCKNCNEGHSKFKSTRNHVALTGIELPKDPSIFESITKLGQCGIHPTRKVEFKCTQDNQFVCSLCATMNHRQHTRLVHIEELVCDVTSLRKQTDTAIARKTSANEVIANMLEDAENLNTEALKLKFAICPLIDKIVFNVHRIESQFVLELYGLAESEISRISSSMSEWAEVVIAIDKFSKSAETIMKYGTKRHLVLFNEHVQRRNGVICHIPKRKQSAEHTRTLAYLRSNIAQLETIFGVLLDISSRLFNKIEYKPLSKTDGKATDTYNAENKQVLKMYRDKSRGGNEQPITKVIFHEDIHSNKMENNFILNLSSSTSFRHVSVQAVERRVPLIDECVGTPVVDSKSAGVGTIAVPVKHESIETVAVNKKEKCVGTVLGFGKYKYKRVMKTANACVGTRNACKLDSPSRLQYCPAKQTVAILDTNTNDPVITVLKDCYDYFENASLSSNLTWEFVFLSTITIMFPVILAEFAASKLLFLELLFCLPLILFVVLWLFVIIYIVFAFEPL